MIDVVLESSPNFSLSSPKLHARPGALGDK
jgi:hypothetical protein